ncbi:MAG: hypothetical protein V3T84_14490 [Phycisphaerales bacterium]
MRRHAAMLCLGLALTGSAHADSVTLDGSSIPLRGCTIRAIQSGRVYFLDSLNHQQHRPLNEIEALGFDGLEQLDRAEAWIAEGLYANAIDHLLVAALRAQTTLQRLWVEQRLARVHNYQGEYVQAAGHAAAVFLIQDDPYWQRLSPRGEVNEPPYAAAKEAMDLLNQAGRKVTSSQLQRAVREMTRRIRPVYDRLAAAYQGPLIEPSSTISGILKSQIDKPPSQAAAPAVPDQPKGGEKPAPPPTVKPSKPTPPSAPTPSPSAGPDSAESIDRMLTAGRPVDALAICERVAQAPGDRDLSRFLYQYGMALTGVGRERDGAVMFARCAVLFGRSSFAAPSLIETASIYQTVYRQPRTAQRLLERAVATATAQGQPEVVKRARRRLGTLDE